MIDREWNERTSGPVPPAPTTGVCREFGVSRKTGYKIFDRYKAHGLEALSDRSRRPARSEMATTLIAHMSELLAPISKSTTRT